MHIIAAKAVAFHEAMQPEFASYQQAVLQNAKALARGLNNLGFRLVTGGTDNHLVLIDLSQIVVTGSAAEKALDAAGITVNKNAIPFDPHPPQIASGIRLGTPAVTSRGFGAREMELIAQFIVKVLSNVGNEEVYSEVHERVSEMCREFPVPGLCA